MIRAGALLLAALTGAAPALAGQYHVPAQCKAHLTVQARGCLVSHYYRCEGEPAGNQWRVDIGAEGPFFVSQIDDEGQWLFSEDLIGGFSLRLKAENPDPASLSQLFATGRDDYDFGRLLEGAVELQVRGHDELTGKRVTIDGVELEETTFAYRETGPDGLVISTAKGREYVHRDWRLFFSGVYEDPGGETNRSPARFDEPGDKGFLSDTPEYDCTGQMAAAKTESPPTVGLIAPVRLSLASSRGPAAARPKE